MTTTTTTTTTEPPEGGCEVPEEDIVSDHSDSDWEDLVPSSSSSSTQQNSSSNDEDGGVSSLTENEEWNDPLSHDNDDDEEELLPEITAAATSTTTLESFSREVDGEHEHKVDDRYDWKVTNLPATITNDNEKECEHDRSISVEIRQKAEWLSSFFGLSSSSSSNHQHREERSCMANTRTSNPIQPPKVYIPKQRHSKLVAERLAWLLEQPQPTDVSQRNHLRRQRDLACLPEGVAMDRSKWLQAFVQEHATAGQQWEEHLWQRQQRSRNQQPTTTIPSNTPTVTSTTPSRQRRVHDEEGQIQFGSFVEKMAWFLAEMTSDSSRTSHRTISSTQPEFQCSREIEIDMEMPYVDDLTEDLTFLEQALVELEQEGLLPGFLAEHTGWWLFGGTTSPNSHHDTTATGGGNAGSHNNHETIPNNHAASDTASALDILRLDYPPAK